MVAEAGVSPITARPMVDFPEPDSPTRPTTSPAFDVEADAIDGEETTAERRRPIADLADP